MSDSRAAAVALATRGFRVFRLNAQTLRPAAAGFTESASSEPNKVYEEFSDALGEPHEDQPGILTGDNLAVLDFDVKPDKVTGKARPGLLSLAELLAEGLPDDTLTVRTATGGLHKYYHVDNALEFRNRVGWLEGVDVRGYHGYVVAPGAERIGVGPYTIVRDMAPAALPAAFQEQLSRVKRDRTPTEVTDKYEDDWSIGESIKILESVEAIDGQKHADIIAAMHKCFDLGVTPDTLENLIPEYIEWFADLWTQDLQAEMGSVVQGRIRDGKAWGVDNPRSRPSIYAVFDKVSLADPSHEGPRDGGATLQSVFALECYAMEGTEGDNPLVHELLDLDSVAALYGPSNVGKSFAGASLAYAVATGGQWAGRAAVKGLAVYIAYEGARRFRRRLAALVQHHDPRGPVPLALMPPPKGSIHSPGWHAAVLAEVRRLEAKSGELARLIVVDTLAAARVGAGKEENDNDAMNEVAGVLRKLAEATGACVMVIHHTGKDKEKGMRGASALEGAVDTALMLDDGVLKITKQREYDRGPDLGVSTVQVTMCPEKGGAKSLVALVGDARVVVEPDFEPLFLQLLDKITARGVRVTASKHGSYAPKLMLDEPEAKGVQIKHLEHAMRALMDAKTVVVGTMKDSKRRERESLIRAAPTPL